MSWTSRNAATAKDSRPVLPRGAIPASETDYAASSRYDGKRPRMRRRPNSHSPRDYPYVDAFEIETIYGRTVVKHGGGFPGVSTHLHIFLARPTRWWFWPTGIPRQTCMRDPR